jgi:2-polyprenyl-6-methoxyphenol hydroxylase-like FAD-dependent oxidoreductase
MDRLRVRIVGGSLGGVFLAALLHGDGHDVAIYERSRHGLGGRGAGLMGRPELFELMRVTGCEQISRIGVTSKEHITLDRAGEVVERNGRPSMQISWDYLYRHFVGLLPAGAYRLGAEVVGVEQDKERALLTLADGTRDQADLVIGADGVGSVVRAAVNGPASASRYAGYVAWRGLFPETWLAPEAAASLFDYLAYYPLGGSHIIGFLVAGPHGEMEPGARRYNWVWYRPAPGEEGRRAVLTDADGVFHPYSLAPDAVPPAVREQLLEDARALLPPAFAAVVAAEPRPFIQGIFDYEAPAMRCGRIALLGDAAFTVRPHTGRGAAKAAGDALALYRALQAHGLDEALEGYQAERAPAGRLLAAKGRELGAQLLGR